LTDRKRVEQEIPEIMFPPRSKTAPERRQRNGNRPAFPPGFVSLAPVFLLLFTLMAPAQSLAEISSDPPIVVGDIGGIRINVLFTNDMHGFIGKKEATWMNPAFPPGLGGAPSLASFIWDLRRETEDKGEHFLLLDAGDIFQGTPVGDKSSGEAVVEFMNRAGYDAMTVGNHDFDHGMEAVVNIVKTADFPVLGANIIESNPRYYEMLAERKAELGEEGEKLRQLTPGIPDEWVKELLDRYGTYDLFEPYIILNLDGLKLAILGLTTIDTKTLAGLESLPEVEFLPIAPVARYYLEKIRLKESPDLVFCLSHVGVPWNTQQRYIRMEEEQGDLSNIYKQWGLNMLEFVASVKGVDVAFGGHIHWGLGMPYEDPVNHTLCFQTYGKLSGVGHACIGVDEKTRSVSGYSISQYSGFEVTLFDDEFWPQDEMNEFITTEVSAAEVGFDEVIGHTVRDLPRGNAEHIMGQLCTDAIRDYFKADFAILNRGGIREMIKMGPITPRDIYKVLPFGNTVTLYSFTGEELKRVIEVGVRGRRRDLQISGGRIVVDMSLEDDGKVIEFIVNGEPLDPGSEYRVVTSDYLASGSAGYDIMVDFPHENTGVKISDALTEYIRGHSPIDRKFNPRIKKIRSAGP